MNKPYRELVGLQVTFSKVASLYKLVHYYKWKQNGDVSPALMMEGYDMPLTVSQDDIVQGLRNAYAPAVLSIWQQDAEATYSELLQFGPGGHPDKLMLDGDWTHYAEW